MKKKLITLSCALLFAFGAFAQVQFALGIKGGMNFAKLNVDEGFSTKSRTGFHGGAFALIKLTKIGIQPEIIFSQQGSKLKFDAYNYEANYSYINIPVILKLYTIAGINLQAGPQFGFVTSADQKTTFAGITTKEDVKDRLKGSDISLALGAGWDLPFGLTIDARYNLGLTKVDDDSSVSTKNQVIQISVGYKLIKFGK
jgi:hypothetical protein